jgi:hypothetical protein
MTGDTPNKARKAFWGITLIGFLLPWIVIISCEIYFGQAAEIKQFPTHLFESRYNFFLGAVMNATPKTRLMDSKWTPKACFYGHQDGHQAHNGIDL